MNKDNLTRYPLNGTFELTARCNLNCKMCLVLMDSKRMRELGGRERTGSEWVHMARQVQEAGTVGLLLTGGEPMVHPEFLSIYREIAQMGFILTLYTNGTLITPKIMEVLEEYPPHRIGVTIYGASPETYERVTGSRKAYGRMLRGMEELRRLPSRLSIRTTIIKDNLGDLDRIAQWASEAGGEFNISRIVTKTVRGGIAKPEECRLTPEENVRMLSERNRKQVIEPFYRFAREYPQLLQTERQGKCGENTVMARQKEQIKKSRGDYQSLYGCEAGMNSYCITWDGKLVGCQLLGDCWTEPFAEGFQKAWEDFPGKAAPVKIPLQCRNCEAACSACPATRLAETGYPGGCPEYLCKEGKLAQDMENRLLEEIEENILRKEG